MAKRKRLGPAALVGQGESSSRRPMSEPVSAPPIAQVAGAVASNAAAQELADALTSARAEGRLAQDIGLDEIDETHLTRDRIAVAAADMAALEASIETRGQQMPLEVVDLGAEARPRYGLISGWRRLAALRALQSRTGEARFATARAVLRRPETAAEAYLAMVEENELRVGLSYYERAQVAARSTDMGVFESSATATRALFPTASKAKRSKINAFIRIFRVLDPVLSFPEAIGERLGLQLSKALDAGQGAKIYKVLEAGSAADAEAELALVARALAQPKGQTAAQTPPKQAFQFNGDIALVQTGKGLVLRGGGVDGALLRDLRGWLSDRQAKAADRT